MTEVMEKGECYPPHQLWNRWTDFGKTLNSELPPGDYVHKKNWFRPHRPPRRWSGRIPSLGLPQYNVSFFVIFLFWFQGLTHRSHQAGPFWADERVVPDVSFGVCTMFNQSINQSINQSKRHFTDFDSGAEQK